MRALNGSILITGSVGSGKTQGLILPYFTQVIKNLKPGSSALVVDPKLTFCKKARDIALENGRIVRFVSLFGKERFNPVYVEDCLKSARFMKVAEMVRAVTKNFGGGSRGEPFWEIGAFNLLKNVVVYCAAIHGYYTLRDIYEAILLSTKADLGEDLISAIEENSENKVFDEEEIYNIECAIKYFRQELRQLDSKIKTGIMASSTLVLNQFQEYRASRIFCPKKEEITIHSMDQVIDDGEILILGIENDSLAKSMGTVIKLHFEESVLDRLSNPKRSKERTATIIIDELQDVITCGGGQALGDERCLAKCREANVVWIGATQAISSLKNSVKDEKAVREYVQNFRTRIALHSSDDDTIRNFKELVGRDLIKRTSTSLSENSFRAERNLVLGGFDSEEANISESISESEQKDYIIGAREFTELATFEALGLIFDGVRTRFIRLNLKPYFLKDKATPHEKVIEMISEKGSGKKWKVLSWLAKAALIFLFILPPSKAFPYPDICDVAKQSSFSSCLEFDVKPSMCHGVPGDCAQVSYYVPQTYYEATMGNNSHFAGYPGADWQLSTESMIPYGTVNDSESQSFKARAMAVPHSYIPFSFLPCGGSRMIKLCFDGRSEDFTTHWRTGTGDLWQPRFLAWKLNPKACLVMGALSGPMPGFTMSPDSPMCGLNMSWLEKFPPSSLPVCTSWGVMFPRSGTYVGGSEVTGSLAITLRLKSLLAEVTKTAPASMDEKWMMVSPTASRCFRSFEPMAWLETGKQVNNRGRLKLKSLDSHLYVDWKRVSCSVEWPMVPVYKGLVEVIQNGCRGKL